MRDVKGLLGRLAAEEEALGKIRFLAPRSMGGRVRTRVSGLVRTYDPRPRDFCGWGVFQPIDEKRAQLVEEAGLAQVAAYLALLKPVRLRLVRPLGKRCWLGFPLNESDARQRLGFSRPLVVHLVEDAAPFECVLARYDDGACWFEEVDRRSDPAEAEFLREALAARAKGGEEEPVRPGLTPEARVAFGLAVTGKPLPSGERRVERALAAGGGRLNRFQEQDGFYAVEWTDSHGVAHSSTIRKDDLTVLSAGICLSGEDQKFDLQSLVGVAENFDY